MQIIETPTEGRAAIYKVPTGYVYQFLDQEHGYTGYFGLSEDSGFPTLAEAIRCALIPEEDLGNGGAGDEYLLEMK